VTVVPPNLSLGEGWRGLYGPQAFMILIFPC